MYDEKYLNKDLYCELIKQSFTWFPINRWTKDLNILVYDSDVYPVRDFSVVFSNELDILYYGWGVSEAYYSTIEPKEESTKDIYYIRNLEYDTYIFFYKDGRLLNDDYEFYELENDLGEINAKAEDGHWYLITKDGVRDSE